MIKKFKFIYRIITAAFLMPLLFNAHSAAQDRPVMALMERNIIPSGHDFKCYISYRIPFDKLIFVQKDGAYQAGCSLEIELTGNGKIISRKSDYKSASADSYDATLSKNDFLSGVIQFDLQKADYVLRPYISIDNSSISVPLDTIPVRIASGRVSSLMKPFIIEPASGICDGKVVYPLVNMGYGLPYSDQNYRLFIPLPENAGRRISVKFEQDNKVITEIKVSDFKEGSFTIGSCEGKVALYEQPGKSGSTFAVVKDFSYLLDEGNVSVSVMSEDEKLESYTLQVMWMNKPRALMNPEYAVRKIDLIGAKQAADSILAMDEDDYYSALKKYWDNLNPGRNSRYNELMDEFYRRVDYCNEHFSTLNKMNGAESDRGKIYIRFGKPDQVKRSYSKENAVMEIWVYTNLNQEFVFTDESGLGNYTLLK